MTDIAALLIASGGVSILLCVAGLVARWLMREAKWTR